MDLILLCIDYFYIFMCDIYDIWFYIFPSEGSKWEKSRYSLLNAYIYYKDTVTWLIQYLSWVISAWFAEEYLTYVTAMKIIFLILPKYLFVTLPLFLLTVIKAVLLYFWSAVVIQARSDWFYLHYFLETSVLPLFNFCPFYYQAILYSLVIYVIRLIRYSNVANEKNIYVNSSLQWIYLVSKYAITRIQKYSYIYDFISSSVISLYLNLKYSKFWMQRIYLRVLTSDVKAENKQHLWRPLFKRISYFGYFSSLRSKWSKNRKR